MGNQQPGNFGGQGNKKKQDDVPRRRMPPPKRGGKIKRKKGVDQAVKLPNITPVTKCRLRQLRFERIKDYLLMEQEFISNHEKSKPKKIGADSDDEITPERKEVEEIRGMPLDIGTLEEWIDEEHAIVQGTHGPQYYVGVHSFVDKEQIEPGSSILMHHKNMSVVGIMKDDEDPSLRAMKVEKAPLESYADIGGLDTQIQEIKEAVELPLTHPQIYEEMGIKPPKGVILYGPPGTGKTLLAKAVASETSATFLRMVGSELIQKYLGDGPKLVRELFKTAEEHAPTIIFIDEIDAVGEKRYQSDSGGTKEIQRTMLELLTQLDGFDTKSEVKVIMATNKIEHLDPALIRPGRIDRKIEFPPPDYKTKKHIFTIHTQKMNLHDDVNIEDFINAKDELSGADIKALCTEAGLLALRERRMKVNQDDFEKARDKVLYLKKQNIPEGLYL